jgi:uncharacterized protein (DUF1800 family)
MKKAITTTMALSILAASCTIGSFATPKADALSGTVVTNAASQYTNNDDARVLHLLNRITFGPTAEDVALVKRIGINEYINQQLDPRSIPVPDSLSQLVFNSPALTESPLKLVLQFTPAGIRSRMQAQGMPVQRKRQLASAQSPNEDGDQNDAKNAEKSELKKQIKEGYKELYKQILQARVARDVESPRQLEEVMTDFWYNHFNVSINKGIDRVLVGSFEQQAIRPYALGKFRDLLEATAHHPAMLFYLDNWQNTAPNSAGARGKLQGINENYARELMELHTLGVDGGYTQNDVVALAHILTGLGFPRPRQIIKGSVQAAQSGCYFDKNRHDFSDKQFLGYTIRGTGEAEIEQALDILAKHPATAHHVSYQLAQYFVSDTPPTSLVDRMAQTFARTDGDIKSVMSTMLHSSEFWDTRYVGAKYKSPYRYAISVLRAAGVKLTDQQSNPGLMVAYRQIDQFFRQMGEPLYGCLTPDGYKNTQEAWLNSDGLLKRIAFANRVAKQFGGPDEVDRVERILASRLSQKTRATIESTPEEQKVALLLGSPEFMTY